MLTIAPETERGEPACYVCGGLETFQAGRFSRDGIVLTCLDCGHRYYEPTRTALARMQAEIDLLRERLGDSL
jgi:hypothetical protein